MKVTYLGTTVLLFDDGEDQILFDAHLSRPSLTQIGLKHIQTDKKVVDCVVEQYKIHRLKAIFISHTHSDHVMDAPYLSEICGADIYGSASARNVARGGKVSEDRIHCYEDEMRNGSNIQYNIGAYEITVIPSLHSKAHWYNNDLGKVIDHPLIQPAGKKDYKEGGSYDFLVKNGGKTYLIRPSFNYIEGQLDGIQEDYLFLGIAGISKADAETKKMFFKETIGKGTPKMVIPIHWDNFFRPLFAPSYQTPKFLEDTNAALYELASYCGEHDVPCTVLLPLCHMNF